MTKRIKEEPELCPAGIHPRSAMIPGAMPPRCGPCMRIRNWKNRGVPLDKICMQCGFRLTPGKTRRARICQGHESVIDPTGEAAETSNRAPWEYKLAEVDGVGRIQVLEGRPDVESSATEPTDPPEGLLG
jgi:Zn ribbon nucleic-acid-binding protein